ncbi:thiolase C-terminal domain-containing protein [Metapseudomonas furukawaii]|uniref:thiolase C-terminal domain-containing protein n=1 Tax=Metapseudomonas furukawaii TaxID=1149133 RepID=UPI00227C1B07|nr:lipid-transfer protein [Pseudomonas furukawaii]WAG76539.1 lipid-transfer protein [Pseudomonas furukawaii]
MQRCVNVIGVDMSAFSPAPLLDPTVLVGDTVRRALVDAGLAAGDVGTVFAASGLMETGALQRALELTGLGPVPLRHLAADSCSLLHQACQAIEAGQAECILLLGVQDALATLPDLDSTLGQLATAAREYMVRYRTRRETFAMVAVKARQHALCNSEAVFRQELSLDQVLEAPVIAGPLTHPQFAWPTCGVAAVLLCSREFARRRASGPGVRIIAQARVTPQQVSLGAGLAFSAIGYEVNVAAAQDLYEQAGWGPQDVGVCELHDSSTLAELLLYEALGFCAEGSAEKLVEDGDNTYGGNLVVNPSGGLLSLGRAPSAGGLAQCIELVRHLRGRAGQRQVANANIALQHQVGTDGTVVATLYQRE